MTNRVTSYCKNDTPESTEAGNGFAGVYSTRDGRRYSL